MTSNEDVDKMIGKDQNILDDPQAKIVLADSDGSARVLLVEVQGLLAQAGIFCADQGFQVAGKIVGIIACAESRSQSPTCDLTMLVYPLLMAAPDSLEERELDEAQVAGCLADLEVESEHEQRSAVCERLGQLGGRSARLRLEQAAQQDTDSSVRQAAEQALVKLDAPRIHRAWLAGIELRLVGLAAVTDGEIGRVTTNSAGYAVFKNVPGKSRCRVQLAGPAEASSTLVPRELGSGAPKVFSSRIGGEFQVGDLRLRLKSQAGREPGWFDVEARFEPPFVNLEARPDLRLVLTHRNHTYHAAEFSANEGFARFLCLPEDDYALLLVGTDRKFAGSQAGVPGERVLSALSRVAEPPMSLPQILHPGDHRLLIVVEPDSSGCVVLTAQTISSELRHAAVCYTLEGEAGEFILETETRSRGEVWRGTARLRRPYTGDEAIYLSVQVFSQRG